MFPASKKAAIELKKMPEGEKRPRLKDYSRPVDQSKAKKASYGYRFLPIYPVIYHEKDRVDRSFFFFGIL